jgi:hypothetical protein
MVGCAKLLLALSSVRHPLILVELLLHLIHALPSSLSVPYSCVFGLYHQVRFLSAVLVEVDPFIVFRSIDERTLVYFADNPRHILGAYIESGEGIDRAGGFVPQVDDDDR